MPSRVPTDKYRQYTSECLASRVQSGATDSAHPRLPIERWTPRSLLDSTRYARKSNVFSELKDSLPRSPSLLAPSSPHWSDGDYDRLRSSLEWRGAGHWIRSRGPARQNSGTRCYSEESTRRRSSHHRRRGPLWRRQCQPPLGRRGCRLLTGSIRWITRLRSLIWRSGWTAPRQISITVPVKVEWEPTL